MRNAILTVISDSRKAEFSSLPELQVFLESVKSVPNAELVVFADVLNRPLPHIKIPRSMNVILDRWLFYYRFLSQHSYDQVLLIDSRDVYFQSDPFAYAQNKVLLTSEGVEHGTSGWNNEDQELYQRETGRVLPFGTWPVVNGGVVMGPTDKVRAYCLLVYMTSIGSPTHTDQAAINQLYNVFLKHDSDYGLMDPRKDMFCITGETVYREQMSVPTTFKDGMIHSQNNIPFALFHQWERTRYRDDILSRFGLHP